MPDACGEADRRRRAGFRGRDDQVGLDRGLGGQPATDLHPGGLHAAAGDGGVRAGQVDVLEDAALGLRRGEVLAAQPVGVDRQQFARLDLADERRADDVQRGGLGGDHPAAVQPAEHQRVHAVRVAGRVQGVLVAEDQAERALEGRQQLHRGLLEPGVGGPGGQQPGDHVGVGGALAAAGLAGQRGGLREQFVGVDQVAVVAQARSRTRRR